MVDVAKRFLHPELDVMLQEAVDEYDLSSKSEFSDLEELSSRTILNGIDVHGQAAILEGDKLFAPATVFVTLAYGEDEKGAEAVEFEDNYPARVVFDLSEDGRSIEIVSINVDTSSFFD